MRAGTIVFWSAQSLYKYLPQYDEVFPRIARTAGDCQFVSGWSPRRCARGSIAPLLYTGSARPTIASVSSSTANSELESLTHDLPIVTLAGPMMRGRHSAAILQMLGVTETISETLDGYVNIAVRLALDPQARRAAVDRMAANKHRLYSTGRRSGRLRISSNALCAASRPPARLTLLPPADFHI